jgi:hypothetical protein
VRGERGSEEAHDRDPQERGKVEWPGIVPDEEIGLLDQGRGIEYVRRRDKYHPFCPPECVSQRAQLIPLAVTAQEYDTGRELSEHPLGQGAEPTQRPGTEFPSGKRMHDYIRTLQTQ